MKRFFFIREMEDPLKKQKKTGIFALGILHMALRFKPRTAAVVLYTSKLSETKYLTLPSG